MFQFILQARPNSTVIDLQKPQKKNIQNNPENSLSIFFHGHFLSLSTCKKPEQSQLTTLQGGEKTKPLPNYQFIPG